MKSLSLSRPLVVMMLGTPGAGKSFFARQFSETFNAPLVSYDRLRHELLAEPHFIKDEELIVQRIALTQIEQLFKTQRTFIIDGGMSARAERADMEKMAKNHSYGSMVIWIQTDTATAKYRSMRRNPQKIFDEYNISIDDEIYDRLAKKLTPPSHRETVVVISGKHTYATQAKMVLKKLVSPRDSEQSSLSQPDVRPPGDDRSQSPPIRRSVTIR